ncbi:MAG: aminotransferase class I/II-fold pyridoxal phosphate-dependent enzyme [Oscillospiraceae bacterium]|jgi:aminotransferase|nr:aminotransferase class I/II-fold pyridoxal phosphate-dependent enzyme [Oscillospiraceae bacterium]
MGDRAMALKPSGIRKFFDILETMPEAISLGIGEPDFVTPWPVRDMGIYSLEKGFTKYTPNAGLSELRTEIARYMRRHYGLSYEVARQTLVTVGGSEGIDLLMRAVLDPGDEVLIPQPSFVCYGPIATLVGARPVYIETTAENEFRLTAAQLRGAITPKTRLLVLPFPNNPTGGIMAWPDLEAVAEVLRGTEIMVLSDEIYAELTYGVRHVSLAQIPDMYERTVVINGLSKSHAMTGWRMGYACGPENVIQTMVKIHQYAIMSAPTTSQYAAIEALRNGDGNITAMREEYDTRRRFVLDRLRGMGLPCFEPLGAFYVFPDIRGSGLTSDAFCERLLREKKVATVPGEAFGDSGSGFVRCCYATSMRQLTEAMDRIESFLETIVK